MFVLFETRVGEELLHARCRARLTLHSIQCGVRCTNPPFLLRAGGCASSSGGSWSGCCKHTAGTQWEDGGDTYDVTDNLNTFELLPFRSGRVVNAPQGSSEIGDPLISKPSPLFRVASPCAPHTSNMRGGGPGDGRPDLPEECSTAPALSSSPTPHPPRASLRAASSASALLPKRKEGAARKALLRTSSHRGVLMAAASSAARGGRPLTKLRSTPASPVAASLIAARRSCSSPNHLLTTAAGVEGRGSSSATPIPRCTPGKMSSREPLKQPHDRPAFLLSNMVGRPRTQALLASCGLDVDSSAASLSPSSAICAHRLGTNAHPRSGPHNHGPFHPRPRSNLPVGQSMPLTRLRVLNASNNNHLAAEEDPHNPNSVPIWHHFPATPGVCSGLVQQLQQAELLQLGGDDSESTNGMDSTPANAMGSTANTNLGNTPAPLGPAAGNPSPFCNPGTTINDSPATARLAQQAPSQPSTQPAGRSGDRAQRVVSFSPASSAPAADTWMVPAPRGVGGEGMCVLDAACLEMSGRTHDGAVDGRSALVSSLSLNSATTVQSVHAAHATLHAAAGSSNTFAQALRGHDERLPRGSAHAHGAEPPQSPSPAHNSHQASSAAAAAAGAAAPFPAAPSHVQGQEAHHGVGTSSAGAAGRPRASASAAPQQQRPPGSPPVNLRPAPRQRQAVFEVNLRLLQHPDTEE